MRREFLQLLFDSAPAFHCELEVLAQLGPGPLSVRMENLQESGHGLAHCLLVTGGKMRPEEGTDRQGQSETA